MQPSDLADRLQIVFLGCVVRSPLGGHALRHLHCAAGFAALALKNNVPVVAVDPVAGRAKVKRQAETADWPCVFTADGATDRQLLQAFEFCLTEDSHTGEAMRVACFSNPGVDGGGVPLLYAFDRMC